MAAHTIEVASRLTDLAVYTGSVTLMGFAFRESGVVAAAASFIIRDGTTAAGEMVIPVNLLADESVREWFGDEGISFDSGIFLDMELGSVEGSLFVA